MRLFVAVYPEKSVREGLEHLQKEALGAHPAPKLEDGDTMTLEGVLRPAKSPWRVTDGEQLHLTLQFLGDDITVHKAEEIEKTLENVIHSPGRSMAAVNHSPDKANAAMEKTIIHSFDMSCVGIGAFPSPKRATVLWAGVRCAEVERLAKAVADALAPLGLRPDKPFAPHITFARSKHPHDVSEWVEKQKEMVWSQTGWKVDKFYLTESQTMLGGHEHRILKEYRLRPS
jgi:2'-5' RNA ligase